MERALATSRDRLDRQSERSDRRIRLMIVDDSMVARAVLSRMIETDPAFEICAVAGTAEDAIEALGQVRVDVVLLDLEMPGEGGLKSIPRILAAAGGARVMIVSSLAEEGAEETVAALALGAADTLPKPGTGRFNGRFSEVLVGRLKALGMVSARAPKPAQPVSVGSFQLRPMSDEPLEILAIGASTGGIHALGSLFSRLPRSIGVPILITQHLPAPFMPVFARQIGLAAGREAVVAVDGADLLPDRVYVAPGNAHLTVDLIGKAKVVRLTRQAVGSGCLPSVDPMLASLAGIYGSGALGVVLTGMGRDGAEGASRLVACGGAVIAQDEGTSAVWGMPRVIADAGLACAVLPPDQIAALIAGRVQA